jgi:MFS family permease
LRQISAAYALFSIAELAVWLIVIVYAYARGGATDAMLIMVVQLVPSAVFGPFLGMLGDRVAAATVFKVSLLAQAAAVGALAAATSAGAPEAIVYVLAAVATLACFGTRPAQAAVGPAVVTTPEELTAANVLSGWIEGAASLLGPALAGVVLATAGTTWALTVVCGLLTAATAMAWSLQSPPPFSREDEAELGTMRSVLSTVVGVTLRNPACRVVLSLELFYFAVLGSLDFLCVVLAVSVLHMGEGGAGYLNAALGAGAVVAGFVSLAIVGRQRLSDILVGTILGAGVMLALLGLFPSTPSAFVLLGMAGLLGAVFNVTGRTLLQRAAPPDALAGAFSVLEGVMDVGVALGAVFARVALALGGIKAALVAPVFIAVVLLAALRGQLRHTDDSATVPQVEIRLLQSVLLFTALAPPALERIARRLLQAPAAIGTTVITEGERGDRYYIVADGAVEIRRQGRVLATARRGTGFGEIALIKGVPRTASAVVTEEATLYALDGEDFVAALTGSLAVRAAAEAISTRYLDQNERTDGGPPEPTA